MIVVSDTSAVSALLKIGEADLLPRLFERVIVPVEVFIELARGHDSMPSWLEVQNSLEESKVQDLLRNLHRGEAAAIALAETIHPDYLLMDERKGRRIATARGLPVLGLAGVLAIARRRGMIDSIRVILLRLKREARFRLSAAVIDEISSEFGD